ncbi:hypothetical protein SLE2022_389090 [Rubroshorea leprosula]
MPCFPFLEFPHFPPQRSLPIFQDCRDKPQKNREEDDKNSTLSLSAFRGDGDVDGLEMPEGGVTDQWDLLTWRAEIG